LKQQAPNAQEKTNGHQQELVEAYQ